MKCLFCKDNYNIQGLKEFADEFYYNKNLFICPDCYDDWQRLEPEEQIKALEDGADYEW